MKQLKEFATECQTEWILSRISTAGAQAHGHTARLLERRKMILKILGEHDIDAIIQPIAGAQEYQGANIIVSFNGNHETSRWIFDAHYDIDPTTMLGANDNTAAVAQLLQLAIDLKDSNYRGDLMVLLSDLEEPSNCGNFAHMGTQVYAGQHIQGEKEFILCLDVAGNGNVVCVSNRCPQSSNRVLIEIMNELRQPNRTIEMPDSSNVGFRRAGWNATEICIIPALEVATGLRGTWKTLHTDDDDLNRISVDTLQMMRRYLLSWIARLEEND